MIERITEALRAVREPELGRDMVSLGMIDGVRFEKGAVSLRVTLTTPDCPFREKIRGGLEAAAMAVPGVETVRIEMTARPSPMAGHPLFRRPASGPGCR